MSLNKTRINGKGYLEIKEDILRQMDIVCPLCKAQRMYVGDVSEYDPTPCLFCPRCDLRIAIHQIIINTP